MAQSPTSAITHLVDVFAKIEKDGLYPSDTPKIVVSDVVSKIAFLYEKARTIVDFKEEHLLRKDAIRRILSRRMVAGANGKDIALPLIQEMIRAGYLQNETIPKEKIAVVSATIDKYLKLIHIVAPDKRSRDWKSVFEWFLDLAAVEVEEELSPDPKERAMVEAMYRSVSGYFVVKGEKTLKEEEKNMLLYIAILKDLAKASRPMIEYQLLQFYFPNWKDLNLSNGRKVRSHIIKVKKAINGFLEHPLNRYFLVKVRKLSPFFIILQDIIEEDPGNAKAVISNPEVFDNAIEQAARKRYDDLNARIKRSITRSLLYIFVTKMLFALVVEVPIDYYILKKFEPFPLIVNVTFHPLFLAAMVLTARRPGEKNTEKLVQGLKEIVYGYEREGGPYEIKRRVRKRGIGSFVFNIFYGVLFFLSFGFIVAVLSALHFKIVSIILFIFFLSFVSFFGIKIRNTTKELMVLEKKENLFTLTMDLLALPIIRAGRWLSLNFSRVNVFVFVLDVIIEAPFKLLIEVFEDFLSFIREKKEEIYRET